MSPARAHQTLAGAIVAEQAMLALGVTEFALCPWALREGVILRRLDSHRLTAAGRWGVGIAVPGAAELRLGVRCDDGGHDSTSGGLAIIGGGKIGEALLSGLLREQYRARTRSWWSSTIRTGPAAHRALRRPGGRRRRGGASRAAPILIAVKPQDIDALLAELATWSPPST